MIYDMSTNFLSPDQECTLFHLELVNLSPRPTNIPISQFESLLHDFLVHGHASFRGLVVEEVAWFPGIGVVWLVAAGWRHIARHHRWYHRNTIQRGETTEWQHRAIVKTALVDSGWNSSCLVKNIPTKLKCILLVWNYSIIFKLLFCASNMLS